MYNFLGVGSGQGSEETQWEIFEEENFHKINFEVFAKVFSAQFEGMSSIGGTSNQSVKVFFLKVFSLKVFSSKVCYYIVHAISLISRSQYAKCAETCLY